MLRLKNLLRREKNLSEYFLRSKSFEAFVEKKNASQLISSEVNIHLQVEKHFPRILVINTSTCNSFRHIFC